MKRVLVWAVRLYPVDWRRRYGTEFEALLNESGGDWPALMDVLRGAVTIQMKRWNVWKLTAIGGLAGAAIAGTVVGLLPTTYVSEGVILVHSREAPSDTRVWLGGLNQAVLSQASLEPLIQSNGLYKKELQAQTPMAELVGKMRRNVKVSLASDQKNQGAGQPAQAIRIAFQSDDPAKAQQIVTELERRYIDRGLQKAEDAGRSDRVVEVLDMPRLPQRPIKPALLQSVTGGLLIGISLAFIAAAARRFLIAARS